MTSGTRPRVLVLTPDFPPAKGGIQTLTERIVSSFTRLDPTVVTLVHRDGPAFDADLRYRVVRVDWRVPNRPFTIVGLNATAAGLGLLARPSIVLSMHIVASPAAALLRHNLGIPFVQYVHAKEIGAKPGLARFALTRADRVVAVSEYTRDLAITAGARAERVVLIHPGVALPDEPAATPALNQRPTVLTISRLEDRYKGHDVVLRALPLIQAEVPGVQWRVIGDGPLRPLLEDRARTAGVGDAVRFLGQVSDATREKELRGASAFCMVSRLPAGGFAGEGFGIVYLEANAHGLPVVAGDVGGARDAVIQGKTGLLVDPEDHVAVADALVSVLRDRELAERLGRDGLVHAKRLSWQKAGTSVEALLEGLVP